MLLPKRTPTINKKTLQQATEYIDAYWAKVTKSHTRTSRTLMGLPHPYVVPSVGQENFQFEEQYYWDSYFTAIGLPAKRYQVLVEGMLENLIHMYKQYGLIPNASRMYMLSRSQPPILSSYIFLVYERYGKSAEWLQEYMAVAKDEYENVWMSSVHPYWHQVHQGLSRYYDINVLHDLAEAESGWDMTPRFQRKALDYLPIDLNSLLYKYETDFAKAAALAGDSAEEKKWLIASEARRTTMNDVMWGKLRGFYFDYNYQKKEIGTVWSLAGFYTMWVGLATEQQAKKMVANLKRFEERGGLSTTASIFMYAQLFGSNKTQWAHPNGWAPLHYIVIEGLERYGYHKEAKHIAKTWLKTNLDWFETHGEFQEKYNVVNPSKKPVSGLYPSQTGFAWTNAVFLYLSNKYL